MSEDVVEAAKEVAYVEISPVQFDAIVVKASEMAAELLATQFQMLAKIQTELVTNVKGLYEQNPALKGRHDELGGMMRKLVTANPKLDWKDALDRAAKEVLKNAN